MTISPELLYAILAMDSYNSGYEGGLADNGTADLDGLGDAEGIKIGTATVGQASSSDPDSVQRVDPRDLDAAFGCAREPAGLVLPWRAAGQVYEAWLLDVIAPDAKATGQVIANFRQVVKEGDLRIHPLVAGLVDLEMRGKMMDARNAADQAT
jgi:hypothetical protein